MRVVNITKKTFRGEKMENKINDFVNKNTLIGEVVRDYPESIDILTAAGMHCLGCAASQMESIENACMVHGLDPDLLVNALNNIIGMKKEE